MIVDMRLYTYAPARFTGFIKAYGEAGHAIVARHLGEMGGVFIPASGTANRTLQLFAYADHDHRDACRRALRADPAWLDFIRDAAVAIRVQENTIVQPEPDSPVQDPAGFRALSAAPDAPDRLFELRTRAFHPGQATAATAAEELQIRRKAGELPIALLAADTGPCDRILALSAYASAADRDRVNRALAAAAPMAALRARLQPLLKDEVRELWQPLPCSPLR